MAGTPQKRARAAAAAAGEIPEATTRAPARDARTRVSGRARARVTPDPLKHPSPGPHLQAVGDNAQADIAQDIAGQLQAGLTVRIDRTKPPWCAGWQEDFILESADTAELLHHIRDQYGGRTYKLTALSPGGTPLWVSKLNVGGMPKEEGRVLIRWKYEGEQSDPDATAAPAAVAAPAAPAIDVLEMMKIVLATQKESSDARLQAQAETAVTVARYQKEMMELVVRERSDERQGTSFGGQLAGLVESTKALQKVGKLFGAADTGAADGGDKSMMDGAMEHAVKHFMENALESEFPSGGRSRSRPARRAPRPQQGGIPEAISRPRPSS